MKIKMKIRFRIVVVVLGILVLTSLFLGFTAYFTSRNGITEIAKEFLGYKMNEIYQYASRQEELLSELEEDRRIELLPSAKLSVLEYAESLIDVSNTLFLSVNPDNGKIDYSTRYGLLDKEIQRLLDRRDGKITGWIESELYHRLYVGVFIEFSDWDSVFFLMKKEQAFYSSVYQILKYLLMILAASVMISSILLIFYINRITRPIDFFVKTIQRIRKDIDLSRRVRVYYPDEIGFLSHSFNEMLIDLEGSMNQINNYAYQMVLAKKKEERIRFIFQKYVPKEVINRVLQLPSDSMLVGNKQYVTVLFSDIRSFTSISESLSPEELVLSLNTYFNHMVGVITDYHGIIDKFIGDAIMAIFGAPVMTEFDAEHALDAALDMFRKLKEFNENQQKAGKNIFHIGVGVNTGEAIVGNIGSEQKVDYTVIGDTVNLASRLEGLTKKYKAEVVVSEFTVNAVKNRERYFFRLLDNVRVKGKIKPVKIYQAFRKEDAVEYQQFYEKSTEALLLYFKGDFQKSRELFSRLIERRKDDFLCYHYKEKCDYYIANPPEKWDGVETLKDK